jgi:hypothetical protein
VSSFGSVAMSSQRVISDTALRSYFCLAVPSESACRMVGDLKLRTVSHPPALVSLILGERTDEAHFGEAIVRHTWRKEEDIEDALRSHVS